MSMVNRRKSLAVTKCKYAKGKLALTRSLRDPRRVQASLTETLPLPQRLALAYAPKASKAAVLSLFALDARLAAAIRQASEPIMAQMRLAWWRDQLQLPPEMRERSDELVRALDALAGSEAQLAELIDGWEEVLAERFDPSAYARGRGAGFAALATALGEPAHGGLARQAGRRFALVDLAANLSDEAERAAALAAAQSEGTGAIILPRNLRSLAVLDGLARRSLLQGGGALFEGGGAMLAAIRLGLVGR
jgi:phytoene synthase